MVRVRQRIGQRTAIKVTDDDTKSNICFYRIASMTMGVILFFVVVITFADSLGPVPKQNVVSASYSVFDTAKASGLRGIDVDGIAISHGIDAGDIAVALAAPPAAPPAAPSTVKCGPHYRGVLDPSVLTPSLDWVQDTPPLFAHALVANNCKKWISVRQNKHAGAGHRLRQWLSTLNVVAHLPPSTRVAFAHTSLDSNDGTNSFNHHAYTGFDDFLGLTLGENDMNGDEPANVTSIVDLPRVHNNAYAERDTFIMTLEAGMSDKGKCDVLYMVPKDHWAEDHSTQTRGVCSWKFSEAAKRRAASGKRLALLLPDEKAPWDPSVVHIGVHWRVNDGKLVGEDVLADIISGYVLSALASAGVGSALNIHIFTEKEGESMTPKLSALVTTAAAMGLGETTVYIYSDAVTPRDALWRLSQTDFFIGSVSSFTWIVAQFSTRPASLLQHYPDSGHYKWCLTGQGCCERSGVCNWEAKAIVAAAAARLADMENCGQLVQASWEDEARLPTVTLRPLSKKAGGLLWPGNWRRS